MSKVKKVSVKKLSDQKFTHNSSLSNLNTYLSFSNLPNSKDKPDLFSESPYLQKIPKMRSTSNLKDPSSYHLHSLAATPINSKYSVNLKQKLNLNASFLSKIKEPDENKPKKKIVLSESKNFDHKTFHLNSTLDQIQVSVKENGISVEIFQKLQECFESVIAKDKVFGGILRKIKAGYEGWVNFKSECNTENLKMRTEIQELSRKLSEESEENKRLHRKIQKFSRENAELGRTLEERENNCRTLQEHLLKITNIDVNEVPHDKTSWKVLVSENKSYSELCKTLKHKVKSMKTQEKKLMKLFWNLKQKGYPIEEVYENLNNNNIKKGNSGKKADELSDCEYIDLEPLKVRPRPSSIPELKIEKVEPNSFSDENRSDSEFSLSN